MMRARAPGRTRCGWREGGRLYAQPPKRRKGDPTSRPCPDYICCAPAREGPALINRAHRQQLATVRRIGVAGPIERAVPARIEHYHDQASLCSKLQCFLQPGYRSAAAADLPQRSATGLDLGVEPAQPGVNFNADDAWIAAGWLLRLRRLRRPLLVRFCAICRCGTLPLRGAGLYRQPPERLCWSR